MKNKRINLIFKRIDSISLHIKKYDTNNLIIHLEKLFHKV